MNINNRVKKQYRELINQGQHKEDKLNYQIAVSSGLNVTQEIPDEAYKRAAWASNQGASFIELSLGGPAQIYNEWDNLLSISRQLGLSFDCHFPVQIPFDYANPNRGRREQMGFFRSHEFMYEFVQAWGEFKQELEAQKDVNGRQQKVYGINAHLVKSTIPEIEERMASDVSVDPFGTPMKESKLWKIPEVRAGFFRHYLWDDLEENFDTLQSIASNIEGFSDFNIKFRETLIDHMAGNTNLNSTKYITKEMLEQLSKLGDPEFMRKNLLYMIRKHSDAVDLSENEVSSYIRSEYTEGNAFQRTLTDRGEELMDYLEKKSPERTFRKKMNKEEQLDFVRMRLGGNGEMLRQTAIRNMAGVSIDIPEKIEDLKEHREGASIAQNLPRFDPKKYMNSRWIEFVPKSIWKRSKKQKKLLEQENYQKEMDRVTEILKEQLKDSITDEILRTDDYNGPRQHKLEKGISWGEAVFRDIINFRGGYYEDQLNRESVIFWYIMPWWMAFTDRKQVKYIWDKITEIKSSNYSKKSLEDFQEDLEKLKDSGDYDKIVAAGAGAYVWGHFTQFKGRGEEKTLVELLSEHGLTLDWESHNAGAEAEGKLWKPYDIIKVCEAVNNTKVNGTNHEVLHCTIDSEHLAINGVDPLWVINGNEEKNIQGMGENDGYMITKQHITHPAMSEQQHHHQPIRRGDLLVYRHIYHLVEKGFCRRNNRPGILMYELGAEKAESIFMLRLMMNMMEMGIKPEDLESENVNKIWERAESDKEEITLEDYVILKFYGHTEEEWHHEWQEIFEHALDPLQGLLEVEQPDHTWSGRASIESDNRPEDWQGEQYQ